MPKATIQLTDAHFLAVMNRTLHIPGEVLSVVQSAALRGIEVMEADDTMILDSRWIIMVDFNPITDTIEAMRFLHFARVVYGPSYAIDTIDDADDYAVLENLLAAASTFSLYSMDWVQ